MPGSINYKSSSRLTQPWRAPLLSRPSDMVHLTRDWLRCIPHIGLFKEGRGWGVPIQSSEDNNWLGKIDKTQLLEEVLLSASGNSILPLCAAVGQHCTPTINSSWSHCSASCWSPVLFWFFFILSPKSVLCYFNKLHLDVKSWFSDKISFVVYIQNFFVVF